MLKKFIKSFGSEYKIRSWHDSESRDGLPEKKEGIKKEQYYDGNKPTDLTLISTRNWYPVGEELMSDTQMLYGDLEIDGKQWRRHGEFTQWYKDGQIFRKGKYNFGKRDGIWNWQYLNGKRHVSGGFDNGEPIKCYPRDIFGYFFVDGMLLNRTLDDYEIELFLEHEERVPWRYENVFHPDFSSINNEIFEFQRKCFNDGKLLEYKPEGGWGIHEWYKWLSD